MNYYLHSIGPYYKEKTLVKLENIFKMNGLASQRTLVQYGKYYKGPGSTQRNGLDYISLFECSNENIASFLNEMNSSLIIFVFDIKQKIYRDFENGIQDEIRIKDFLALEQCEAIILPEDLELINYVKDLLERNNLNIPIKNYQYSYIDGFMKK